MRILAIALAVVFFVVAAMYLVPGGPLGHHTKHAILFGLLGVLSLVWLRFQSGASAPSPR